MAFDLEATINVIISHATASGWFGQVTAYEPKSAPKSGGDKLTAIFWLDEFRPEASASGLQVTSAYMIMRARVMLPMGSAPEQTIDLRLAKASIEYCRRVSDDFTLGGNVRNVDLLAAYGTGLGWRLGYVEQDGVMYRISVIEIPAIVNDVWPQAE